MIELLKQPEAWLSLATLTLMEIVLGIDNIIFIAILVARLPEEKRALARRLGISLALFMRLGLLFTLSWIMGLKQPFVHVLGKGISGRDVILLGGGLFLVGKATHEIHDKLEVKDKEEEERQQKTQNRFFMTIVQILLLDIVFSLDSVITAVGMANQVSIMVIAMVLAVGVMLVSAGTIGDFVNNHPSMKILALSFLLLIGVLLIAEGMGQHVSKGYIYFALGFSLLVELINMRMRKAQSAPVRLHERFSDPGRSPSETVAVAREDRTSTA